MKKDITTRIDIELLVNTFYKRVKEDHTIGFFFTEIAEVNWETHLPKMYNFWQSLLFADIKFSGDPMGIHLSINEILPIEKHHFEHWLSLWFSTIDSLFIGAKAEEAKNKAQNISKLMSHKMEIARKS